MGLMYGTASGAELSRLHFTAWTNGFRSRTSGDDKIDTKNATIRYCMPELYCAQHRSLSLVTIYMHHTQ